MTAAVLVCLFLLPLVQGHPIILGEYHSRKIIVSVLDRTYENYLKEPADSPLRSVIRGEYVSYYNTHYLYTFTWLHQVVSVKGSLPEENLLDIAVEHFKANRNAFLLFLEEVKTFAEKAYDAEMRYFIFSEESPQMVKSLKAIYSTYLTDIDKALDLALAHLDFDNFRFKSEVEDFVKREKLQKESAHQVIHDFLAKKYSFRSWMVALSNANRLSMGCHRRMRHVVVPLNSTVIAIIFNVPRNAMPDEEKLKRMKATAEREFSHAYCHDDTSVMIKRLNIDCASLRWTKAILLFYKDSDVFRFTATNATQVNYWPLKAPDCRHEYALVTFG